MTVASEKPAEWDTGLEKRGVADSQAYDQPKQNKNSAKEKHEASFCTAVRQMLIGQAQPNSPKIHKFTHATV